MAKSKDGIVTIWDGVQYRQVSRKEGERLVSKDMAQICPVGGTAMKFRKDFTGYQTREVRAKPAPAPKPKGWKAHRRAAAELLDKPIMSTTKKEVLEYMEQHLGTEG